MESKNTKFVNLEETPFIDVLKKKKNHHFDFSVYNQRPQYTLPTFIQNIKWNKKEGTKKFAEQANQIPQKNDKQIINKIISIFKSHQTFSRQIDNLELLQLLKKYKQLILNYGQKYPKAALASYLLTLHQQTQIKLNKKLILDRLQSICEKTAYPLGCAVLGKYFTETGNIKKAEKFLKMAIEYDEAVGFMHYGSFLYLQGRFIKAYQMYKNAEEKGYTPIIYYKLGQLLAFDNGNEICRNVIAAKKYFDMAFQSSTKPSEELKVKIAEFNKYLRVGQFDAVKIKSTLQTQSKIVGNFLKNKFFQHQNLNDFLQKRNMMTYGMVNSMKTPGGQCFITKTFHVVFSPLLSFPSRGFLAQDQNGLIQAIYLYSWDQIPNKKLQLLHHLGTKVILRQYIRKLGANDQLPIYRVQNPHAVEIYPPTEKHSISDTKYRQFAKILFSLGWYEQCQYIYTILIAKKASNLEIIYSNLGLIKQKFNKKQEAIQLYKKSLKVKNYDKSLFRLGKLLALDGKLKQAQQLAQKIQGQLQRKQLMKLIDIRKPKEQNNIFHKSSKQGKIFQLQKHLFQKSKSSKKMIINYKLTSSDSNISATSSLEGDIVSYLYSQKQQISKVLQFPQNYSQNQYMNSFKQIFNAAELPLKVENAKLINKFFRLCYHFFRMYSSDQYFDQAFGYYVNFFQVIFRKFSSIYGDLYLQFCFALAKRCNYLQNRIEDQCNQLQIINEYKTVQLLCQTAEDFCVPLCLKIAKAKYNQKLFKQNVQWCNKILKALQRFKKQEIIFSHILQINSWLLKSLVMLQKYDQAIQHGKKLFQQIQKNNPKLISKILNPSKQNVHIIQEQKIKKFTQQFFQLFPESNDKDERCKQHDQNKKEEKEKNDYIKQYVDSQKIFQIKKILLSCFYLGKKYEKGLKFSNKICKQMKDYISQHPQIYLSILILKIKIIQLINVKNSREPLKQLEAQNKKRTQILQALEQSYFILQKINCKQTKNQYNIILLKQSLQINLKQRKLELILQYCKKILKSGDKYKAYIQQNLLEFATSNKEEITGLITTLYQDKILKQIGQQVKSKLRESQVNQINEALKNKDYKKQFSPQVCKLLNVQKEFEEFQMRKLEKDQKDKKNYQYVDKNQPTPEKQIQIQHKKAKKKKKNKKNQLIQKQQQS